MNTSSCRTLLGTSIGRWACIAVLLLAAAAKLYQLLTDPALGVLYGSRWMQAGLVNYELLLAVWLLSGFSLPWSRRAALATFSAFGFYALYLGLSGHSSCGCFGRVDISPWWTFTLDVAIVGLLAVWRPVSGGEGWRPFPAPLAVAAAFVMVGMVTLSAALWRPGAANAESWADSNFVLLEPEKWIGQPFPLTDCIALGERLSRGSWIVVFYHHDCRKCQKVLPYYERLAAEGKRAGEAVEVALIEVPPYGAEKPLGDQRFHHGRLPDSKEWLVATPCEVRLTAGRVTAAISDMDSLLAEQRLAGASWPATH